MNQYAIEIWRQTLATGEKLWEHQDKVFDTIEDAQHFIAQLEEMDNMKHTYRIVGRLVSEWREVK